MRCSRALVAVLAFGLSANVWAYTSFTESFNNSSATGWTVGGNALLTVPSIDTAGNGWLQLTADTTGQVGYAYYSQSIPTSQPIHVVFDFDLHGTSTPPADGMTFFLYDSTQTFAVGGAGSDFGYIGSNGALAIGLSDGYPSGFLNGNANTIAIRGASPNYTLISDSAPLSPTPAGTARGLTSSDPNYRRLIIDMTPTGNAGELSVTVRMQAGNATQTVLSNVIASGLPANVGFGFTAATGGNSSVNEVRNFSLQSGTPPPLMPTPALSMLGRLLLAAGLLILAIVMLGSRRRA